MIQNATQYAMLSQNNDVKDTVFERVVKDVRRIDGFNLTRNDEKIVNTCCHLDIADVILCGFECERILFLDKSGRICNSEGEAVYPGFYTDVLGNWDYTLLARDAEHKLHVLDPGCFHIANEGECEAWGRVASYAILNQGFSQGAVVAVCEK